MAGEGWRFYTEPMHATTLLHGASPFGPIFGKELRTTARRKRTYVLRVIYLTALLLVLMMIYANTDRRYGAGIAAHNQQMSMLGAEFFSGFALFSVYAMGIIGPVLTCTAVGSERLQKTLPVLLMTPITAWQIVAGKLFSRLLVAITLLGLSLPVLALVRLLGGVELTDMLGIVCVAAAAALGSAALGLFFSTLINRAYSVILLSYAVMFGIYFVAPVLTMMLLFSGPSRGPASGRVVFEALAILNPFFFCSYVSLAGPVMRGGSFAVPWFGCIGAQLALTALLLLWSAAILRRMSRREGAQAAPAPAALVDSPAGARDVSDNPILWRELRRPLMARRWQRWTGVAVCLGALGLFYLALAENNEINQYDVHYPMAIIFNLFIWLMAAVLSATTVASEKESDTWTLLLVTPVSGSTVVWGKALGVLRRMLFPALLVLGHFLIFTMAGVLSLPVLLLVVWVIFSFNLIWIATGIFLSLRLRKVTSAVVYNLLIAIVLYGGVAAVLGIIGGLTNAPKVGTLVGWYLPYYYLIEGLSGLQSLSSPGYTWRTITLPGYSGISSIDTFGIIVFIVGMLHILIAIGLLQYTAMKFDGFVGRAKQLKRPLGGTGAFEPGLMGAAAS